MCDGRRGVAKPCRKSHRLTQQGSETSETTTAVSASDATVIPGRGLPAAFV
jgi:hypothetical protein